MSCIECRDVRGCNGKEYYEYYEVKFCRPQILWIIEHWDVLLSGHWVNRPEYIDKVQKPRSYSAPFEKPEMILAEVEARLDKTGRRGKEMVIHEVQNIIAQRGEYRDLSPETKDIINYITGWDRRVETYDQWKAGKKYKSGKKYKVNK